MAEPGSLEWNLEVAAEARGEIYFDPSSYLAGKVIGDLVVAVLPMSYGKGRLIIGDRRNWFSGWERGYCYPSRKMALLAFERFDGIGDPPDGWIRSIPDMRRRPDGDPTKEYIAP